jgi:hypothetical protein
MCLEPGEELLIAERGVRIVGHLRRSLRRRTIRI